MRPKPDDRGEAIPPVEQDAKSFLDTAELAIKQSQEGKNPIVDAGLGIETKDHKKLTVTEPAPQKQTAQGDKRVFATAAKNSTGEEVVLTLADLKKFGIKPR